jgi:hypothetical protein
VKTDDFNYENVTEAVEHYQRGFNLSSKRIMRKMKREGFLSVFKKNPNSA